MDLTCVADRLLLLIVHSDPVPPTLELAMGSDFFHYSGTLSSCTESVQ